MMMCDYSPDQARYGGAWPSLDSVIEQYLGVVKPMYHQFIEPTKRYADVIILSGVTNTVAIDLITTKIEKSQRKRVRKIK